VIRGASLSLALAALLTLSACGDDAAPTANEDPSKLSEELEEQAQAIEARAEEAVKAAEQQAAQELRQLRAEAEAASAADAPNVAEPADK
jgi:hypothetical protein